LIKVLSNFNFAEQGRNSQKLKYEYNEDESPPNVDIDFTKIASMAALNCTHFAQVIPRTLIFETENKHLVYMKL